MMTIAHAVPKPSSAEVIDLEATRRRRLVSRLVAGEAAAAQALAAYRAGQGSGDALMKALIAPFNRAP
jgi:hypothetical protein